MYGRSTACLLLMLHILTANLAGQIDRPGRSPDALPDFHIWLPENLEATAPARAVFGFSRLSPDFGLSRDDLLGNGYEDRPSCGDQQTASRDGLDYVSRRECHPRRHARRGSDDLAMDRTVVRRTTLSRGRARAPFLVS